MNKKNNIRYQNTEIIIENAFLKLLELKNLRHITVRELCANIDINRSTFYAHYQDIYDLLNKIEYRLSRELRESFNEDYYINGETSIINYIKIFLTFASKNKVFYKNFVNSRESFPIKEGFDELLNKFAIPYYKNKGISSEEAIIYHFIFMQAGFTMVLKRWLNDNCKDPIDKIADIILNCIIV